MVPPSARHGLVLGEVERLNPLEPALREHLEYWLDTRRIVQAADLNEHSRRETFEVVREKPCAAFRAEVSVEPSSGQGNVLSSFRATARQGEVALGNSEPRRRLATGGFLAVQAMADGNESRVGIEFEPDRCAEAGGLVRSTRLWRAVRWRCENVKCCERARATASGKVLIRRWIAGNPPQVRWSRQTHPQQPRSRTD